jgi:S-adenosylmethionine:tRNA ribosyltransferase-isomerase
VTALATTVAPAAPVLRDATEPPEDRGVERDGVRLLVTDRRTGANAHASFRDLPSFLRRGDVLVVNTSATVPAALAGTRSDGTALAVHVSTWIGGALWMVEPRGSVRAGETIALAAGGAATFLAPVEDTPRLWYVTFALPSEMDAYLRRFGTPIRYAYVDRAFPIGAYQTMFARDAGSAEMPSAARPFTPRVVDALERAGVRLAAITLHCGVSSFEAPERPSIERYSVPAETAAIVNAARARGGRVVAVGTTVVRALEGALEGDVVVASRGWTGLVIENERAVRSVDGILTGFHPEGATHRSLLRAFLSERALAGAYRDAAGEGYFQHEFGDVHLIL